MSRGLKIEEKAVAENGGNPGSRDVEKAIAASPGAQQNQGNSFATPLLALPAERSARSQSRADLLRRALTSPWRLTASGGQAGAERSCHTFGTAAIISEVKPLVVEDATAPRCVDRRSVASVNSQRSLFTIDGLPETLASDSSIVAIDHGPRHTLAPSVADGGDNRGACALQHAGTALGTVDFRDGNASSLHRPWQALYGNQTGGNQGRRGRPDRSQRGLIDGDRWGSCNAASASGVGGIDLGSERSLHGQMQYLQQPQQQQPSCSRLPYTQQPYTTSCPPTYPPLGQEPQPCSLGPLQQLPVATSTLQPTPSLAAASSPGCDDVRNPMSPNYDPSLDSPTHEHGQLQQRRCKALPYGGLQDCQGASHRVDGESLRVNPAMMLAAGDGSTVGGTVRPSTAKVGDGSVDSPAGDCRRGTDDVAEIVTSEGPLVVLEMKGPRGTPSTHAAAAAAFRGGASASPAAPDAAVAAAGMSLTLRGRMASYFSKWRGVGDTLMPPDHAVDIFWSWLGAFLSILVVAVLNQYLTPHVSLPLMIASFGASAVLLFGVPASKLAQPRNFLGGQIVSALVGVLVRLVFTKVPDLVWLSAALGMSLALVVMQVTRTVHPPGGASALIASSALYIGPWYGFKFVLTVFFGCLAMLVVAVVVNNLSARRRYPTYWLGN